MSGHFDVDADVQITETVTLNVFDAFAFEPAHGARLSAGWDTDLRLAVQRRHSDFRAERGLDEIHRHLAQQIIAVTLKDFMRLHVEHDVQIARRTAAESRLAVAGRA